MISNFVFLQKSFPVLARYGELAEKYLYSDSSSCLAKLGQMGEIMVKLIYEYDKLNVKTDYTADKRINRLLSRGIITKDICGIFHALRKARNKALHTDYESIEHGKVLIQMAYSLCEWFMQTYGDWGYINKDFIMPTEEEQIYVNEAEKIAAETKEKAEFDELMQKALDMAKSAPEVSLSDRIKRSEKVAASRLKSEAETRYMIDEQLRNVGWEADTKVLRYSKGTRPEKGRNIAIAEWPTNSTISKGYVDYALFIGMQMVGVIEAKAIHKDIPSVIDYQGKDYPKNIRKEDEKYIIDKWGEYKVPLTFATNGRAYLEQIKTKSGIWFLDLRNNCNAPKALKGWMSPDNISELLEKDIENGNEELKNLKYDFLTDKDGLNLREYQLKAIKVTENAVINGKERVLLAMATGTGKTRTILGMIYRFLKSGRFRRILFLVDRTALGEQAQDVFAEVKIEDLLTLNDIYNIKTLDEKLIDKETRIQVSTVQGMVQRILYPSDGDKMPAVNDFDLIIVDEAHRGYILDKEMGDDELLYRDQKDYQSKYRAVIEYFEAVKIALTATPAIHTTEIFGEPIFTYSYREAVIEGYLVDHDAPHKLTTKLSSEGIHYKKGDTIAVYDPVTGEITNSELLNDELDFEIDSFNRKVITENFNRAVLEEIAKNIDPESPKEQGKTLIYAVNDAHADLIVTILKEIYSKTGVDNNAIMKITGKAADGNKKKILEVIKKFKNENYPSIVVTVDLLTTGIDVPEITTLVFMRRIKSRILFEQMLGRATRLCPEIKKTHFEIYDPVGVYDSLEAVSTMKPVVANPTTTFIQLIEGLKTVDNESHVKNCVDQLVAKLQRKKNKLKEKEIENFKILTDGYTPAEFITRIRSVESYEAKKILLENEEAFEFIQGIKADENTIVVSNAKDELISHVRGYGYSNRPEDYLDAFSDFIKSNMNNITALKIVCTKPKELTRADLKSLRLVLDREGFTTKQLNTAISQMTNEEITADIISIVRRYAIGSTLLSHEERIHNAVAKLKKVHDFSKQELNWINRIEKYILNESVLNVKVFDEDYSFKDAGGFNKINKIFNNNLENIVFELNEYLYDDGGAIA